MYMILVIIILVIINVYDTSNNYTKKILAVKCQHHNL